MGLERIADAAAAALTWNGDDPGFVRAVRDAAAIVGAVVEGELHPGERVSFFVPAFLDVDGKVRPGAILLAEGRVLLGYAEGALHLKQAHVRSVPLGAIADVQQARRKVGPFAADKPSVRLTTEDDYVEIVFNADGTSDALINLTVGVLAGWAEPAWSEEQDNTDDHDGAAAADPNAPLERGRSGFLVFAVRELDEPETDYYPTPALEADSVAWEPEDGEDLATAMATAVCVSTVVGGRLQRDVRVGELKAMVSATGSRLHVACSKYETGRGGWIGFGPAGLATAVALSVAARARTSYARRGRMLVGHIRYPWLDAVLFQEGTATTRPTLRLTLTDPLGDSMLVTDLELHRTVDAAAFATDIAVLAAVHLIETVPDLPQAEIDYLDTVIEQPQPRLSADGLFAGFALDPDSVWLT